MSSFAGSELVARDAQQRAPDHRGTEARWFCIRRPPWYYPPPQVRPAGEAMVRIMVQ